MRRGPQPGCLRGNSQIIASSLAEISWARAQHTDQGLELGRDLVRAAVGTMRSVGEDLRSGSA